MHFDTNATVHDKAHSDTGFQIENEPLLIERLQAFGLIESNGAGGWQLTECCQIGLTAFGEDHCEPKARPAVVRPWRPRLL